MTRTPENEILYLKLIVNFQREQIKLQKDLLDSYKKLRVIVEEQDKLLDRQDKLIDELIEALRKEG